MAEKNVSVMGLHFCYRLWIAELNADISVLRIFDDYMAELAKKGTQQEVKAGIEAFKKTFSDLRKDNDDIKHEMHLVKMNLAALAKQNKTEIDIADASPQHLQIEKNYNGYRKHFEDVKKDFGKFESKWL